MTYVYILQSARNGRYYIGCTDHLDQRMSQHRQGLVSATRNLRPLTLVYAETYGSRNEALMRERWLKAQKSRKLIEDLIRSK